VCRRPEVTEGLGWGTQEPGRPRVGGGGPRWCVEVGLGVRHPEGLLQVGGVIRAPDPQRGGQGKKSLPLLGWILWTKVQLGARVRVPSSAPQK
jgi:hypothetical protein